MLIRIDKEIFKNLIKLLTNSNYGKIYLNFFIIRMTVFQYLLVFHKNLKDFTFKF
jgi:hypothetical protein